MDGYNPFSGIGESKLEGISLRLEGRHFKRDSRGNIYIQRLVGTWNEQPEEAARGG